MHVTIAFRCRRENFQRCHDTDQLAVQQVLTRAPKLQQEVLLLLADLIRPCKQLCEALTSYFVTELLWQLKALWTRQSNTDTPRWVISGFVNQIDQLANSLSNTPRFTSEDASAVPQC